MEGITMPIGLFDPLGFSNGASAEALQWYREAELKHGRVAMAAVVAFLETYQPSTLPAALTMSVEKYAARARRLSPHRRQKVTRPSFFGGDTRERDV
jgi:hypothetical protein